MSRYWLRLGRSYEGARGRHAVPRVQDCVRDARPKQAVVETTAGTFIIDLTPETRAESGGVLHEGRGRRRLRRDHLSPDDSAGDGAGRRSVVEGSLQTRDYGTGGLNAVKDDAPAPKMTRGSVAAVTVPGKPDSAGAQFFIVLADQPALDGKYSVFGHVSDGMEVAGEDFGDAGRRRRGSRPSASRSGA